MGWIGAVEGSAATPAKAYTYLRKTDPNMLGAGNMWIRRGMVACFLMLKAAMASRKLNRKIPKDTFLHEMSKWPYPRECSKCSLAGGCSVYLKQAEIGPSPEFPFDPDRMEMGRQQNTGWRQLQWTRNYRDYRRIDSMEDCYAHSDERRM